MPVMEFVGEAVIALCADVTACAPRTRSIHVGSALDEDGRWRLSGEHVLLTDERGQVRDWNSLHHDSAVTHAATGIQVQAPAHPAEDLSGLLTALIVDAQVGQPGPFAVLVDVGTGEVRMRHLPRGRRNRP